MYAGFAGAKTGEPVELVFEAGDFGLQGTDDSLRIRRAG
jgi:hypothetical protein